MAGKNKLSSAIRTIKNKKGTALLCTMLSVGTIVTIPAVIAGNPKEQIKNVVFNTEAEVGIQKQVSTITANADANAELMAENAELMAENAELTAKNAELTEEMGQGITFARNVLSDEEGAVVLDLNHFGAAQNLAAFVMKMTAQNVRYELLEKIFESYGNLPVLTNAGYNLLSEVLDTIDQEVLSAQADESSIFQQDESSLLANKLKGQVGKTSDNLRKRSESHKGALQTAGEYIQRSDSLQKRMDKGLEYGNSLLSAQEKKIISDLNFFGADQNLVGFVQKMRAENVGYGLLEKIFKSYGNLPVLTDDGYTLLSEVLDSAEALLALAGDESNSISQNVALTIWAALQKKYNGNTPSKLFFESKENVGLDGGSSETTILGIKQNGRSPEGDFFAKIAIAVFDWEQKSDGFGVRAYKDFGSSLNDPTSEFYVLNDVSEPLVVQNVEVELDS